MTETPLNYVFSFNIWHTYDWDGQFFLFLTCTIGIDMTDTLKGYSLTLKTWQTYDYYVTDWLVSDKLSPTSMPFPNTSKLNPTLPIIS